MWVLLLWKPNFASITTKTKLSPHKIKSFFSRRTLSLCWLEEGTSQRWVSRSTAPRYRLWRERWILTGWKGSWIVLKTIILYINNILYILAVLTLTISFFRCTSITICQNIDLFYRQDKQLVDNLVSTLNINPFNINTLDATIQSRRHNAKMVAILFAISSGAEWIYVGHPSSLALNKLARIMEPRRHTGITNDVDGMLLISISFFFSSQALSLSDDLIR